MVSRIRYKQPTHVRHMHRGNCCRQEGGYARQLNGGIIEQQGMRMEENKNRGGGYNQKHINGIKYNEI